MNAYERNITWRFLMILLYLKIVNYDEIPTPRFIQWINDERGN